VLPVIETQAVDVSTYIPDKSVWKQSSFIAELDPLLTLAYPSVVSDLQLKAMEQFLHS
jgi:hypothetical protein